MPAGEQLLESSPRARAAFMRLARDTATSQLALSPRSGDTQEFVPENKNSPALAYKATRGERQAVAAACERHIALS